MQTYSPQDTIVAINGNIISGYADGTFISVEREVDAYTKVTGADGEVSRTRNANKSGRITLTLKQTSNSNAVLGALAALDEVDDSGLFDVEVKDNQGHIIHAGTGWIVKQPTMELASDETTREWMIDVSNLTYEWPST